MPRALRRKGFLMDREAWTISWTIIGVGVALLGVLLTLYCTWCIRTKALQDSLLLLINRVENRIDQQLEQNRQADMARLEQSLQTVAAKMERGLEAQHKELPGYR